MIGIEDTRKKKRPSRQSETALRERQRPDD
jgi:hypothetical protein